VPSLVQYKSEY
jgi:protein AFG1